ncbi:MAG: glycosyltransferase family 4 protein [Acidimicrobiia bacterium]
MRILFVCRDETHASSRVRALQYVEPLRRLGHDVETLVWQPRRSADVAALGARVLVLARRSDVVVLVKPRLHPMVLAALARVQPNLMVDVDDAVWTWPVPFPDRFDAAARHARVLVAGNTFLAERLATRYPSAAVTMVPTAVDTTRYVPAARPDAHPIVVGWIGGPNSLADFVPPATAALRGLVQDGAIAVRVVCSETLDPAVLPTELVTWSYETEVASLQAFDIGIMPLCDDESSWGRCGLKALQYMAVGVPVVATPVGATEEIIEDGASGIHATSEDDWRRAIVELARDRARRAEMGARARRRVEEAFSVTANAPRLAAVLGGTPSSPAPK